MLYAYVFVAIAAFATGGGTAWKVQAWRHESAALAAQVNQRATERLRRQNANTQATVHEREKVVIQEKFIPVREEVDRVVTQVVYRDTACFPDDGLRIIRGAISRANGNPGEPLNAVPASP
jgi:hypothetical protein